MKLIVCSSVLAETFNYSNDPRMWHRYIRFKIIQHFLLNISKTIITLDVRRS